MCCYYILGGNVIFISCFNDKPVIFSVFLELFKKFIENFVGHWKLSFYPFRVKIGWLFISTPDLHKNGSLVFSVHFRFFMLFGCYLWQCWLWYTMNCQFEIMWTFKIENINGVAIFDCVWFCKKYQFYIFSVFLNVTLFLNGFSRGIPAKYKHVFNQ